MLNTLNILGAFTLCPIYEMGSLIRAFAAHMQCICLLSE